MQVAAALALVSVLTATVVGATPTPSPPALPSVMGPTVTPCAEAHCTQGCVDEPDGGHTCTCGAGFVLNADKFTCDNVNECEAAPCKNGAACVDEAPGYTCQCPEGYDGKHCELLNECMANPCQNIGDCKNTATGYECVCKEGWEGVNCDEDVNECFGNHGCSQLCVNTDGGFHCACDRWNKLADDQSTCVDINECETDNGGCGDVCTNVAGNHDNVLGVTCSCHEGRLPRFNGVDCGNPACQPIVGEENQHTETYISFCAEAVDELHCSVKCEWRAQEPTCANDRQDGEELGIDCGGPDCKACPTCSDGIANGGETAIDCGGFCGPCVCKHNGEQCSGDGEASNCCALNGYRLRCNSQHVCDHICSCHHDCDHHNDCCNDCADRCNNNGKCVHGTCALDTNKTSGWRCDCQSGWTGETCAEDIPECSTANGGCQQTCVEEMGSFHCTCRQGYTVDGLKCIDIDDCLNNMACGDHGTCVDSGATAFTCTCDKPSFELVGAGYTVQYDGQSATLLLPASVGVADVAACFAQCKSNGNCHVFEFEVEASTCKIYGPVGAIAPHAGSNVYRITHFEGDLCDRKIADEAITKLAPTPSPTAQVTTPAPTPAAVQFGYLLKSCIHQYNINTHKDSTVEGCMALCAAEPTCKAFEFGVDYGGAAVDKKDAGDCILNSATAPIDDTCESQNLDLYVKFSYNSKSCIHGSNFNTYQGETVEGCMARCAADPTCKAFEFGVDYGAVDGGYNAGDCILNSANAPIDGACESKNLDLYVKSA